VYADAVRPALAATLLLGACFDADIPAGALTCSPAMERPCPAAMVCLGPAPEGFSGRCYPDSYALLPAAADTFVIKDSDASFGGFGLISVSAQPRYGFLRFDLRGLPGATVDARLRLRVMGTSEEPHAMRLRTVANDGWSEATMTFATRPAAGDVVADFIPVKDTWVELDVTATARQEQDVDGLLSLQLEALQGFAGFASREEAATELRPQLMVNTSR
jgi:hypothetical protein